MPSLTPRKRPHPLSLKDIKEIGWHRLTEDEKWRKDVVLAMLHDHDLHHTTVRYHEGSWNGDNDAHPAPMELLLDRDVLLARLARPDFHVYYTSEENWSYSIPVFRLPECFLDDKEVVIATLHQYPEILKLQGECIAHDLLNDTDVFHAYVHSMRWNQNPPRYGSLRDKLHLAMPHLVETFSPSIRCNQQLMLQAAEKGAFVLSAASPDFMVDTVEHAMALLSSKGTDIQARGAIKEGNVCAPVYKKENYAFPDDALGKFFSKDLRADPKIVLEVVRKNGRCLKDAANVLHWNESIVRAACQNDPTVLAVCLASPTRSKLCGDKEFMLETIFNRLTWSATLPQLYRWLSLELKKDLDIIQASKISRCLDADAIPEDLQQNPSFWEDRIRKDCSFWYDLPEAFEMDERFAKAIVYFLDRDLVQNVLERFPHLEQDRTFWEAVFDPGNNQVYECFGCNDLEYILRHLTPAWVLNDKDLMIRAVELDYFAVYEIPAPLNHDRDLVELVVSKSEFLGWMSASMQRMYPDLVVRSIRKNCRGSFSYKFVDGITEESWSNLEICRAWFESTNDCHDRFPAANRRKPEFAMLVAQYACAYFDEISPELRNDKAFVLRAIQVNPYAYLKLSRNVMKDHDIVLATFTHDLVDDVLEGLLDDDSIEYLMDRAISLSKEKSDAAAKIQAYEGFVGGFLPGFSVSARESPTPSCVSMIDTDPETSLSIQKMIASYLGVPPGKKVGKLKTLVENLDEHDAQRFFRRFGVTP